MGYYSIRDGKGTFSVIASTLWNNIYQIRTNAKDLPRAGYVKSFLFSHFVSPHTRFYIIKY